MLERVYKSDVSVREGFVSEKILEGTEERIVIGEVAKIKGESSKQMERIVRDNFVRLANPLADSGFSGLL